MITDSILEQIKAGPNDKGLKLYDPGYLNTAPVRSSICYIDGDAGILRYRGYPIEELAEGSSFVEVAYLLSKYWNIGFLCLGLFSVSFIFSTSIIGAGTRHFHISKQRLVVPQREVSVGGIFDSSSFYMGLYSIVFSYFLGCGNSNASFLQCMEIYHRKVS